jgi:hypothetical protein
MSNHKYNTTKILFLIPALFSFTALPGQPLAGVYTGRLREQNVVLSISENGTSVTGKLYRDITDVLVFTGTYENNALTGSLSSTGEKWPVEGSLTNQHLNLTITAGSDSKKFTSVMQKVSANPSYSVKKAFDTFRFDKELLGEWRLIRVDGTDGIPRSISQIAKGLTYTFYNNGTYKTNSPYLEEVKRKYNIKNAADPLGNWETQGNLLYRLGP